MEVREGPKLRPCRPVLRRLVPISGILLLTAISLALARWGNIEFLTGPVYLIVIPASLGGLLVAAFGGDGEMDLRRGCVLPGLALLAGSVAGMFLLHESLVCLAMISVIWLVAALGGAAVNSWYRVQRKRWESGKRAIYGSAWVGVPLLLLPLCEPSARDDWQVVTRSIEIAGSPDRVWPLILSIPEISAKEGRWNVSQNVIGIPRPTSARLEHVSGRLVRKAQWGADIRFEEQITSIVPGQQIEWRFRFPDRSISQYTDRHIHPDSQILTVERGGYRIERAGGGTRLTLWTRYRQRSRLPWYTAWWGERYLGDIQSNVLAIVKGRAETL